MNNQSGISGNNAGWEVITSIALELDVVLAAVNEYGMGVRMPEEFVSLLRGIPAGMKNELDELLFSSSRKNLAVLEPLAFLAGVLEVDDYLRVTLAMRELTLKESIEYLKRAYAPLLEGAESAPISEETLVNLGWQGVEALYQQEDLSFNSNSAHLERIKGDLAFISRVFKGGDLYDRFWSWLDRFYFECYRPWRETRIHWIQEQKNQAEKELGALKMEGASPSLEWLPPQNFLRIYSGFEHAVNEGRLRVAFWAEPFGLADMWSLFPGKVLIAFAEPGVIYENFQVFAKDVASRVNALSDPTRIIILRLIRHFGMVNTEIASYLGLSRPTVSIHVKILRDAGLISSEQVGREMRHRVIPSEVRRISRDLEYFLDLPEEE